MIIEALPWEGIFVILAIFGSVMLFNIIVVLPESREPDQGVSLRPLKVVKEYFSIYKNRDFLVFSSARGFLIGALLAYVASAPHVLMDIFGIEQSVFGYLFGLNAAGLIMGSQVNRFFLRKFTLLQVTYTAVFVMMLSVIIALIYCLFFEQMFWVVYPALFLMLTSIGFLNPNVTALGMEPFKLQAGKASALLGAVSMVFGASASFIVSQIEGQTVVPLLVTLVTCAVGTGVLLELYRKKYAKGYTYAKAFYKSPYMLRQRAKEAEKTRA
jgi:DHA1 family bicyclomycin/chloramphenicol resistance-like MFS transporter